LRLLLRLFKQCPIQPGFLSLSSRVYSVRQQSAGTTAAAKQGGELYTHPFQLLLPHLRLFITCIQLLMFRENRCFTFFIYIPNY